MLSTHRISRVATLAAATIGLIAAAMPAAGQAVATRTRQAEPVRGQGPDIGRFMRIRAPGSPALAPDGTLFVLDWPDGINQLYRRAPGAPIDAPMDKLTDYEDGINSYSLSPDGRTIIVVAAIGGSEQNDLYRLDPKTGAIGPIFEDPNVVYSFQLWLADSSGFVYQANDDSPSDFHLYHYDLGSGDTRKLLAEEGWWGAVDVTGDLSRMLVGHYISASRAEAFEVDTATGTLTSLNLDDEAYNWPASYDRGERSATVISDHEEGIRRIFRHDLSTGRTSKLMPDLDPFPIEGGAVNEDRSLAAILYNEGGYRTMRLLEMPSMREVPLPPIDKGLISSVEIRGRTLTWTLSNARNPGLAYAHTVGSAPVARPLTIADDQGIDLGAFTLPRLIRYPSFDGLEIPAFLFTPPGHEAGTAIPFVILFHGGPESQARPSFSRTVQYLLSRGFGVMQPNVRGSTGYGRRFHMLDNYTKRWDSVRDGAEAARWLVSQGYAEAGKIAAYGGSYGGFMAVATVIEGADVYGASVDVVGIVNFKTFLEQTKDYRRKLREAEYGPLSDPEFLESISPIHRMAEIQVPMLIAHGLNDPRVPVGEAMQLAVGLQQRGLDPELLFFPDEGHGFAKLDNRLLFYRRTVRFLEKEIGSGSD